jgi:proteasome lid subunit RPN8/RPN11
LIRPAVIKIREIMHRAARDSEYCGLMIGRTIGSVIEVDDIRSATNVYKSPANFAISPADYTAVAADIDSNHIIVGLYHSHANKANASYADRENMRLHSLVWLILGRSIDTIRELDQWKAYECKNGLIRNVKIVTDSER